MYMWWELPLTHVVGVAPGPRGEEQPWIFFKIVLVITRYPVETEAERLRASVGNPAVLHVCLPYRVLIGASAASPVLARSMPTLFVCMSSTDRSHCACAETC